MPMTGQRASPHVVQKRRNSWAVLGTVPGNTCSRGLVRGSGSRVDGEISIIQDCFLGLVFRYFTEYWKHWLGAVVLCRSKHTCIFRVYHISFDMRYFVVVLLWNEHACGCFGVFSRVFSWVVSPCSAFPGARQGLGHNKGRERVTG